MNQTDREPAQLIARPPPPAATHVYCDGACTNNGRAGARGGIGVFFGAGDRRNISTALEGGLQTNQRAELTAILLALRACGRDEPLVLHSDSSYGVSGANEWRLSWRRRGWTRADGGPVLNLDLWQAIDTELDARQALTVLKHVPRAQNSNADALAKAGAEPPAPRSNAAVRADVAAVEGVIDVQILVNALTSTQRIATVRFAESAPKRQFDLVTTTSTLRTTIDAVGLALLDLKRHESPQFTLWHRPAVVLMSAATDAERRLVVSVDSEAGDDAEETRQILTSLAAVQRQIRDRRGAVTFRHANKALV